MTEDKKLVESSNYHTDPRLLILEAAERSGLLKKVANLIWFADRHFADHPELDTYVCPMCDLVYVLTEAFDKHTGTPHSLCEGLYADVRGGGFDISPQPGTEDEAAFETFYAGFCKPDQTELKESQSPPPTKQ